jgi:hypothetical protein
MCSKRRSDGLATTPAIIQAFSTKFRPVKQELTGWRIAYRSCSIMMINKGQAVREPAERDLGVCELRGSCRSRRSQGESFPWAVYSALIWRQHSQPVGQANPLRRHASTVGVPHDVYGERYAAAVDEVNED